MSQIKRRCCLKLEWKLQRIFFGNRSDQPGDTSSLDFQDVFPNQFFLVMSNYLGRGFPVIIDRYTGYQVWNQPVVAYRHETVKPENYLGPDPAQPGTYRVVVTTTVWWARDDVPGGHVSEPFAYADGPSYQSRTLRYEVWLDGPVVFDSSGALQSSGNVTLTKQGSYVLGGAWVNNGLPMSNSHPDYIWVPHDFTKSNGYSNPNVDRNWVTSHFTG